LCNANKPLDWGQGFVCADMKLAPSGARAPRRLALRVPPPRSSIRIVAKPQSFKLAGKTFGVLECQADRDDELFVNLLFPQLSLDGA
ncbi:MAG: hypothetical protein LBC41_17380, partial [Clostridiales bacterium]|nr:hypothetical protein [Clostridiales bacterium]